MDAERIIGSLIRGAIGGRGKRGAGAVRFLTGGKNSFLNASTLLTVAGVAWGLMESASPKPTVASPMPTAPTAYGNPPPVPDAVSSKPSLPPISGEIHRLIRLTISAAGADGSLSRVEQEQIVAHARESGAEPWVQYEMDHPTPLPEIVSGVVDRQLKEELYELAFAIVRADEGVSGGERIYLAQLAHQLGLEAHTVARIEKHAAEQIDKPAM